jgi:predicted AAA+ superfamily ATPase
MRIIDCYYHLVLRYINYLDILLIPYNYVFNPKILSHIKLKLENKIIIIDEAHNVKNVS